MAVSDLPIPERNKVLNQQKSGEDLPSYFNATLRKDVKITREFEAFLILATVNLKSSALQWIQQAVSLNKLDKNRDELLKTAMQNEFDNATLKLDECNLQLDAFTSFQSKFFIQEALNGDPDVQIFLTDLQNTIGTLVVQYDRAYFDQTISKVMLDQLSPVEVTTSQLEELQSWTSVISVYLG
jgi:hypothetical protein